MTKKIIESPLQVDQIIPEDGSDMDIEEVSFEEAKGIPSPHLAFLIPGIRTAGIWVQDVIDAQFTFSGREIILKCIRGNGSSGTGRLSSWHLVTRFQLSGFRRSFLRQIEVNLDKHPNAEISIFAHSMGSSLLAEILTDLEDMLAKRDRTIENIVFLGSVCHRSQSERIAASCNRFINDVGVEDIWPFRASVVRSWSYSDVGLWGFRDGFLEAERYFYNDHTSCTSIEHLEEKLIPLLDSSEPVPLGIKGARPKRPFNDYENYRRIARLALLFMPIMLLAGVYFLGWIWAITSTLIYMGIWVGSLLRVD